MPRTKEIKVLNEVIDYLESQDEIPDLLARHIDLMEKFLRMGGRKMTHLSIRMPPCRFGTPTEELWHKDRPCQGNKVLCGCLENEIDMVAQQSCHPTKCRFYEVEAPE